MHLLLSNLILYLVYPVVSLWFFCLFCYRKFQWRHVFWYPLACFLAEQIGEQGAGQSLLIAAHILLLALYGIFFLHCDQAQSFIQSSLVISVVCLTNGIAGTIGHLIAGSFLDPASGLVSWLDLGLWLLGLLLLLAIFTALYRLFYRGVRQIRHEAMLLFVFPLLFISLAEQTVISSVYGDTIIWDTEKGLIYPVIDSPKIAGLHLLACIALFSILAVYYRFSKAVQSGQALEYLRRQSHDQAAYIREAQDRYEQTRAFRHDVRNHLLVLGELIKQGHVLQASQYLSKLDSAVNALSYQTKTGNTVVDVLLNSKLSLAVQKNMEVDCAAAIPASCNIEDMDWCIILSNALDNAIHAGESLAPEKGCIRIRGKLKGNFYLLNIENRCRQSDTPVREGIGLSNIRFVVEKYGGTLNIERSGTEFRLNILFLISQHENRIPRQTG